MKIEGGEDEMERNGVIRRSWVQERLTETTPQVQALTKKTQKTQTQPYPPSGATLASCMISSSEGSSITISGKESVSLRIFLFDTPYTDEDQEWVTIEFFLTLCGWTKCLASEVTRPRSDVQWSNRCREAGGCELGAERGLEGDRSLY